jgi:hypothetical protein
VDSRAGTVANKQKANTTRRRGAFAVADAIKACKQTNTTNGNTHRKMQSVGALFEAALKRGVSVPDSIKPLLKPDDATPWRLAERVVRSLLDDEAQEQQLVALLHSIQSATEGGGNFAESALGVVDDAMLLLHSVLRTPSLNARFDKDTALPTIYFFVVFLMDCAGVDARGGATVAAAVRASDGGGSAAAAAAAAAAATAVQVAVQAAVDEKAAASAATTEAAAALASAADSAVTEAAAAAQAVVDETAAAASAATTAARAVVDESAAAASAAATAAAAALGSAADRAVTEVAA